MHDSSLLMRRRPLWPVFVMPAALILAAAAWSAFWFYAASQVDTRFDGWREREARSGRTYTCAKRSVAGFPFRLEVRCEDPQIAFVSQTPEQAAERTQLTAQLRDILVIAQIYDPSKIIAEFTGPAIVNQRGDAASYSASWTTGRASVAGIPSTPQRVSLSFDNPALDRIVDGSQSSIFRAGHFELHTRLAEGTPAANPVLESALKIAAGSIQGLHSILAEPFDADLRAQLRGLKNISPKPWPERFREIQAAGGRIDLTQSRVQQGDVIAVCAGSLALTPTGYLDGELTMTVAGMEKIVPLLGIDRLLAEGVPQSAVDRIAPGVNAQDVNKIIGTLDRMIPGLGNVARKNANAGVAAGINLLGQASTLEGRAARAFPFRFVEGAVFIGPLKVGQTPPLF